MSGIGISTEVIGLDEALLLLDGAAERAQDIGPLGLTLAEIFQSDVDQRFDSSPGVRQSGEVWGGVFWEALSEAYLRANPSRESGQQYRDTGKLLNSFQVGDPNNIFESGRDFVVFGSALEKARGLNNRRQIVVVHPELIEQLRAAIALYIGEGKT